MPKLALYVPLKARPGKDSDVADFPTSALALVQAEPGTLTAYSMMPDKRSTGGGSPTRRAETYFMEMRPVLQAAGRSMGRRV